MCVCTYVCRVCVSVYMYVCECVSVCECGVCMCEHQSVHEEVRGQLVVLVLSFYHVRLDYVRLMINAFTH